MQLKIVMRKEEYKKNPTKMFQKINKNPTKWVRGVTPPTIPQR